MKKKILAILLVAMMVVSILPVSAFAEAAAEEEVEATCPGVGKTHSLTNCSKAVEKATVEGDCTAWGYTIYECPVCGDDFADDFVEPTKAHKVSNPTEEAVAATCTEAGKTAAGVCDVCGSKVESTVIPPLGHKKADDDKGTACKTEDGKCGIAYKCVTCGENFVVETEDGHVWGKLPVVVKEPGYYTEGEAEYTCTACGATKIVPIRAEHECTNKVSVGAAKEPTCEEDGLWGGVTKCTECGKLYDWQGKEIETAVRPALGHNFAPVNLAAGKTYTYTTTGIYYHWSDEWPCSDNIATALTDGKAVMNYYGEANANGWGSATNPVIVIDLEELSSFDTIVITSFGGMDGISHPDGYVIEISVDGEKWVPVATSTSDKKIASELSWVTGWTVESTITLEETFAARYVKVTPKRVANFVFLSEIAVIGYTVDSLKEYVPSTCVKAGHQVIGCANGCGKTVTEELPLAPHQYNPEPLFEQAATCEKYGFALYACDVCGDIKTVDTFAPLGHTPYACATHTKEADANCRDCSSTNKVKVDPTCTKNGSLTWNCGDCGKTQSSVLNPTGCDVKTVTVAATCRQYGYTFTYCANACDAKDVVLGATEATVTSADKKLTATVDVTVKGEAVNLLSVVVDFEGGFDPNNHTRDNSESYYLVAPTCTTGGTDVFFCAYCDFYKVLDVDALGHDFTIGEDNATYTEATCTAAGFWTVNCAKGCTTTVKDKNNKDVTVPVSTVIVDEKAPALGHEYADATKVQPTVTNPTCVADGYKFYDCLRCSANGKFDAACDKLVEKLDKLVNKAPVDGRNEVFNSKAAAEAVHSITSWKVLRKGDCQLVGLEVAKCDTCKLDILAVIPDTGHHVAPDVILETVATDNYWAYPDGILVFTSMPEQAMEWWAKALLEYDEDLHSYSVVELAVSPSTDYLNWTVAENQIIVAAFVDTVAAYEVVSKLNSGDRIVLASDEVFNAKEDTCLGDGYTAQYNCVLCGELVKSEVVKHTTDKVIDVAAKAPTCTEKGATEGWHCANCDYKVVSTEIAPTGHRKAVCLDHAEVSCTQFAYVHNYCPTCGWEELWGYEKALGHDYSVVLEEVGCLTDGENGCSRCDATENVEAKGHEMTVKVDGKDTTVYFGFCDQTTPEKATCNNCDKPETTGHRQTSLNTIEVAATCVEYGYYLTTCDDCEWYSMVKIDKLADHKIDWDAKKYVAPTFHAAGSRTGTCSVCKGEFTEEIKALEGLGYFVSLDNAVVSGAELVDSATLAVTIAIDGNNADVWGVRFNVEYDKAVLKFDSFEFVCDEYNLLGEVNDNNGYVTVVANMSNKDATGVGNATINAETSLVVLYFTVSTNNTVVKESAVTVKPVEAINAEGKAVAVNYAGEAKFAVASYLDANEDGAVNLADALYIYNIVSSGSGEYDASVDVDKDGVITLFDFIAVYKFLSGEFVYADMVNGGVKVEAPKA